MLYDLQRRYELFDNPSNSFNMGEFEFQFSFRPGHMLVQNDSKTVYTVTSTKTGETITVVSYCYAGNDKMECYLNLFYSCPKNS